MMFTPQQIEEFRQSLGVTTEGAQEAMNEVAAICEARNLAAERERRAALAADFAEYLYRVASQVPLEHAAWAQARGAALLAALKA